MRTRIALAAAATAALSIGISTTVLGGDAGGRPTRAARPMAPARHARDGWTSFVGPTATAATPERFLLPALSAAHRPGTHRGAASQASWQEAQALGSTAAAAHVLQMERVVEAWRAAHPAPVAAPPPPPARPAPPPQPAVVNDATSTTTPDWACIRVHESGDRFNTPAVPGGAYGFLESTWLSLGYSGWPYQASPAVQDQAVLFLYREFGWQPWSTRFVCGL